MSHYPIHTLESAPESSKPLLEKATQKFGFLPNMLAVQANSPALLEGYMTLAGIFDKSTLSPGERQLVMLAVSRENECEFCVPAHTGGAMKAGVDKADIEAARNGTPLADPKLNALRDFARDVTLARGHVSQQRLQEFLDAGYTPENAFEVILGISVKVLTNYADAISDIPLNDQLAPLAWTSPSRQAAE